MYLDKCVLFSYGTGGHTAQMNNLLLILKPLLKDYKLISISDNKIKPVWSDEHFITGEVRKKFNLTLGLFNLGPLKILRTLKCIKNKYQIKAVISTGPGISILSALYFKFRGAKIIHIETWSRFTTYSLTGRIMYRIADKFYIQHKSLIKLYPKAIYSGLL